MGFLSSLFNFSRSEGAPAPLHPFIAEVINELGDDIASAPSFEQNLTQAMSVAAAYLSRQINTIPGTIELAGSKVNQDPLLNTLFHTADDIRFALGRSIESRETVPNLARAGLEEAFAVVGMRCRESDQIPGHPPVFADHSLKSIAASEAEVRDNLGHVAMIRVLKAFDEHVDKMRRKGKLLRVEWNITNPHARGNNATDSHEFIYAEDELKPENVLRGLCAWLANPAEYLRIVPGGARVAIQKPDSSPTILDLPVLHSTDRRQWFVCIVRFSVAECMDALNQEARTHRYIYI